MRARFIGCGGAFDWPNQGNSAIWIDDFRGGNLLVDCGFTVYPRLVELGIAAEVDAIAITHLHADHAGSLTNLLFYKWLANRRRPVPIYCPAGLADALTCFLRLQLITPEVYGTLVAPTLDDGIVPIDTTGDHVPGMPTFGYAFNDGASWIVHSGDTGNPQPIFDAIGRLGIRPDAVFHEIAFREDIPGHTFHRALDPWLDSHRIYGYHCDPAMKPPDCRVPLAWENQALRFE